MEGLFLINTFPTWVLFDYMATHFFTSINFIHSLGFDSCRLDVLLKAASPLDKAVVLDRVFCHCVVKLDKLEFLAALILLVMLDFDVILGMDYSSYHMSLDCFAKIVTCRYPGLEELVVVTVKMNSFTKALVACLRVPRIVCLPPHVVNFMLLQSSLIFLVRLLFYLWYKRWSSLLSFYRVQHLFLKKCVTWHLQIDRAGNSIACSL